MHFTVYDIQGGSNMTETDLCVRLYKSVPVIFEPPCILYTKFTPTPSLRPSSGLCDYYKNK